MYYILLLMILFLPFASFADDEDRVRYISVQGQAEIKKEPDQALLMINLSSEDKELIAAKEKNDKKLRAIYNVANDFDIEKNAIHSLSTRINPRYEYRKQGKRKQVGYVVTQRIRLTLEELKMLGRLLQKLVGIGIDQVEQVQYSLQDQDKAREQVMLQAVDIARNKAEKIATRLNESLGEVLSVQEAGNHYQPPIIPMHRGMEMMAMSAHAAPPEPPVGEVVVRYNVSVQFAIE